MGKRQNQTLLLQNHVILIQILFHTEMLQIRLEKNCNWFVLVLILQAVHLEKVMRP